MPVAASLAVPGRGLVRFQRLRVLFALVVREMSTRFGRSYGGYFWAIAQPLGGVLLLNIVFSLTLRRPPLGTNFPLFYATGVVPFFFFTGVSSAVAGGRLQPRAAALPGGLAARRGLRQVHHRFITMLIVGVLLTGGIMIFYRLPVTLDPLSALTGFTLVGLLGLGVGTINCVLFGLFPTWRQHLDVVTGRSSSISGMIFIVESLPVEPCATS